MLCSQGDTGAAFKTAFVYLARAIIVFLLRIFPKIGYSLQYLVIKFSNNSLEEIKKLFLAYYLIKALELSTTFPQIDLEIPNFRYNLKILGIILKNFWNNNNG
ncbi:hypothetical protein TI05_09285 [Achromatium sp. WMS3]|nr:hypothetical protein TI05_09285 [Achromatium sp. WMS3]